MNELRHATVETVPHSESARGRPLTPQRTKCIDMFLLLSTWFGGIVLTGCTPTGPNELEKLGSVDMVIKEAPFRLWIADEFEELQKGLMFVTAEQMAPLGDGTNRGMIFVFDHEQTSSFWMKNTIIPLDIAYLDRNGTVVGTHTMAPLDERYNQYPPTAAYKYAIEVTAGRWSQLGVVNGDALAVPPLVLKRKP